MQKWQPLHNSLTITRLPRDVLQRLAVLAVTTVESSLVPNQPAQGSGAHSLGPVVGQEHGGLVGGFDPRLL